MVDTSNYFYELSSTCTISDILLEFCRNNARWHRPDWSTFLTDFVPPEIYKKDSLVNKLIDEGWQGPAVFKSEPESIYKFHYDRPNRPVALNMIIGDHNSDVFFYGDPIHMNQFKLVKLDYKPHKFYLLNTLKYHAVFNYGIERYILSISPPERFLENNWRDEIENVPVTDQSKKTYDKIVKLFQKQKL